MKRFGQYARLKAEKVDEYKKLHATAWPKVLETIALCNIKNYSIYLVGDQLFAYFEYTGSDFNTDMARMEADPVTRQWWKHTKPCFLYHDEKVYYSDMDEIFHCD